MKNKTEAVPLFADMLDSCASFNLRKLTRMVTSAYNEALKPTGLRSTQVAVLLGIGAHPDQSITTLSAILSMDVSTLQRSLAVLEKKGLIEMRPGRQREKKIHLTQAGLNKLGEAKPHWEKAQSEFIAAFGSDEWAQYHKAAANFTQE